MTTPQASTSPCRRVRTQLEAFEAGALSATDTAAVKQHLLDCQLCSEAFGERLWEEVARAPEPRLQPPRVPGRTPPSR